MIEIIPAIDLIEGKCVRLTQGDYGQKKIYNENPLEVAKEIEDAGIKRLHLVDLDGAKQKKIVNHNVLELLATKTKLFIDFGGGLQSDEDLAIAFKAGAQQITGGSIAIKNKPVFSDWITKFGAEKIILGADFKEGNIAVGGWEEKTSVSLFDHIQEYTDKGLRYCICTDVSKDGLLQGPSYSYYKQIGEKFPQLKLIASGGVTTVDDIEKLNEMGIYGAIIGKAFYEGKIKLSQLTKFLV